MKRVHKMFIDIIKFVVAVQIWFERFGCCYIIDWTTVLEWNKHKYSKYYQNNNNNNKYTSPYSVSVTVCLSYQKTQIHISLFVDLGRWTGDNSTAVG